MNLDIYKKAFPESTDIKTLHAIVEDHHKGNLVRINHKQKLILEEGYKAIGLGALNKSCKSCLAKAAQKVRAYVEQYIPITTYTRVKKVVKTKVVKKSESNRWNTEEILGQTMAEHTKDLTAYAEEGSTALILSLSWAELKKYATSKGVSVYKKNKEQILKELGV